jgi:hypothetical protein
MLSHLQMQIKTRMMAQNLTINNLEKHAGLKRSAVCMRSDKAVIQILAV